MPSPTRNTIALRYLESLGDANLESTSPRRLPLQPTLKYNSSPTKYKNEDLDNLAKQLDLNADQLSPSKTALLRTRFESPSVTVSAFKSPGKGSTSSVGSFQEEPSWATRNYKEGLSPSRVYGSPTKDAKVMKTPARPLQAPNLAAPGSAPKLFTSPRISPTKSVSRDTRDSPSKSVSPSKGDSPSKASAAAYEYLCRIQAIKDWLETVLEEEISQEPVELITYIRNGIHLGKLANVIMPTKRNVFTNDSKLQFRHTENINRFFHLLDYMNVPDLFRFELTDLYDAKNVPKVWFCLHAMSYMLNKMYANFPKIQNLVGSLEFSELDIKSAARALVGTGLPNFSSADSGSSSSDEVNTNNFMDKLIKEVPIQQAQLVQQVQHVQQTQQKIHKVFVESAIQTDNPFVESTTIMGFNVGSSTQIGSPKKLDYDHDSNYSSPIKNSPRPVKNALRPVRSIASVNSAEYGNIDIHTTHIIKLQSLSRGANFRYKMFVDKIILKSFAEEFNVLFSVIRGNASRSKTVHRNRGDLIGCLDEIITLQALARSALARKNLTQFTPNEKLIVHLQSVIRAESFRKGLKSTKFALFRVVPEVTDLQAIIRGRKHKNTQIILSHYNVIGPQIIGFQSICRRVLYNITTQVDSSFTGRITQLQAAIRGLKVRSQVRNARRKVSKSLQSLTELQAIARGGISRSRLCNNVLVTLLYEDVVLNELYAKVRANNVRAPFNKKKRQLKRCEYSSVLPVQTLFRGVMLRFQRDIMLEDIYNDVDQIIEFQSIVRGTLKRSSLSNMLSYYNQNVDQVIRAQAMIRSYITQAAYKSLINLKNPPLSVVSKFAYLLTDNDLDFQEQMELAEMKDKIIEVSKHNEDIENQIETLDIKLSLLDKNKITVEEFIKHKNKYKTYKPVTVAFNSVDKLNKSSRERIELYQSMFYFLQTRPIYFVRLYNSLSIDSKSTQYCADLQLLITSLFPIKDSSITHHSREEYYFMKLILSLMENDIQTNSTNISDLTKAQSSFWIDYFLHFNNHTYQRQHLKNIVGKLVALVIESDDLDFESDPTLIYESILDRETRINGYTDREPNIPAQSAIKVPEVSDQFVSNLMGLREMATDLLNLLEKNISRIPIHVRIVCSNAYKLSRSHYPEKSEQQHLAVAGVIFIKHYISTVLQYPENFGYLVKDPFNARLHNPVAKNNLKHLSRVMLQLFSMKPFSDNFLKPLNEFVSGSTDMAKNLIIALISVEDLDKEYDLNDYDDIITHERPKLIMSVNEMIQIEKIVNQNIDIMTPRQDDQLFTVSNQLYEVINSADDYLTLTELGTITLNLNPKTKEDSVVDSKLLSLFTQAKRCVLYIMRIQNATGLLELLISGIEPYHEVNFKEMVLSEANESRSIERRRPYYRTSLGDLTSLTFHELKTMCLQIIIQLETMGELTRKDSFQVLLNQLAVDIKTKDSQRVSRSAQLEIASRTVGKLSEKEMFLKRQLLDYNKHIETILSELQLTPKDRKIFNIIPVFTKQYFYHRELRKRNRLPKFGSYKYSAKKLLEQEVLIDFGGAIQKAVSSSSKVDFMFSCHEVGKFTIEAANGAVNISGAFTFVTLDQLLSYQYENQDKVELFDGMVVFDVHNLTGLIFRKFYDLNKDKDS